MKNFVVACLFMMTGALMAETIFVGENAGHGLSTLKLFSDSIEECSADLQTLKDDLQRENKVIRINRCAGAGKIPGHEGKSYSGFSVPGKLNVTKKASGEVIIIN